MKLKAYDKYHKQWVYIILGDDDEIRGWKSSNASGVFFQETILFQAVDGDKDSCNPKRWSDLEQYSIIET
jgi:hypothetical protein